MNSQLPLKQIELKNNRLFTIIIVCSTIFSVFNFLLNYYLIKSLSVNANSNKGSFEVKNHAKIQNDLSTRVIDGSKFDQFRLEHAGYVNFTSRDNSSHFKLANNRIEIQTNDLRILSQDEKSGKKVDTFRLKDNELYVRNVESIHTGKQGGLDIRNSLETPSITGTFANDLELNSLTKSIEMSSKGDLSMQSKYSQMNLDSLKDLNVNGRKKIILDSKFIQLKKLNRNQATNKANENHELHSQVCVCKNGKLFAVAGDKLCKDDANGSICY